MSNSIIKPIRKYGLLVFIIIASFLIGGYLTSDTIFFKKLMLSNDLTTPMKVFLWTTSNYAIPRYTHAKHNAPPRYLLEKQKWMYCDEGATVMATFDHILGYKTRLIDLYGYDNIAHHTILEVFENGKWVTYDFTKRIHHTSYIQSSGNSFLLKEGKVRPYPKLYNAVINNNSVLKKVALKLRGIE